MRNKSLWFRVAVVSGFIAASTVAFQNCSKTTFNTSAERLASLGFGTVVPQPPPAATLCGAFDSNGTNDFNCDANHAFTGNLYVEPRDQLVARSHGGYTIQAGAHASIEALSREDWLSGSTVNGVFTPYTIVASSFDTLSNPFSNGFTTQAGERVSIPDANGGNDVVSAWFAFRADAVFHLAPDDEADQPYQFAVIADDGARVYMKPTADANYQMIVDDQTPETITNPGGYIPGTQYPRMGCSATLNDPSTIKTVTLSAKQMIGLRLTYFQGPIGLSLRLMYRKVPAAGANDDFCETDVNGDGNLKSTVVKSSPTLDPSSLPSHGWKVINASNLGAI